MKKSILSLLFFIGLFVLSISVYAQGMMGQNYINNQQNVVVSSNTAQDEAKGKAVWDRLQAKQTDCGSLTDDDFDVLGDYFMGLMMGLGHGTMNDRMSQMMGDQGEKEMHIVMGKRFSGCDSVAVLPSQYQQFSYMMPYSMMAGGLNSMMRPYGYNALAIVVCGISLLLGWTVLILSIVALSRYIKSFKRTTRK